MAPVSALWQTTHPPGGRCARVSTFVRQEPCGTCVRPVADNMNHQVANMSVQIWQVPCGTCVCPVADNTSTRWQMCPCFNICTAGALWHLCPPCGRQHEPPGGKHVRSNLAGTLWHLCLPCGRQHIHPVADVPVFQHLYGRSPVAPVSALWQTT